MKYIALTIGPIYKTLSSAKKTQELWAGSYMFSYVMKELIKTFRDETNKRVRQFVIPHVDDEALGQSTQVGLFHDRFIFKAEDGDMALLENSITKVVNNLANKLEIEDNYLRQYLQIHFIEYDTETEDEKNVILGTSDVLDALELKYQVAPAGENKVKKALANKENFFKKIIFLRQRSFSSLPEIALKDIISDAIKTRISEDDNELSIYEDRNFNSNFKPHHKYIAIVHADGDNMGKTVKNLENNEYQDFSEKLFDYCTQSAALIKEYGGETIFAGGDDLLFFAPVANMEKGESIFTLISDISRKFDTLFEAENIKLQESGVAEKATLSFGVSITYYKYPLYEALGESRDLLFYKAKNSRDKNNIAFTVTKHSGQKFGAVISKNDTDIYEQFLSQSATLFKTIEAANFLHSFHHKLESHKVLISRIAHSKKRLKNFFDNFFNESGVHEEYDVFFASMASFIHASYTRGGTPEEALERVYASLRFVKFLKGDKS